jgi:hypothetical protein
MLHPISEENMGKLISPTYVVNARWFREKRGVNQTTVSVFTLKKNNPQSRSEPQASIAGRSFDFQSPAILQLTGHVACAVHVRFHPAPDP